MNQHSIFNTLSPNPGHIAAKAIEVRNLSVWFHESTILRNISVSFNKNEINCIIGPSGGGKSTLVRSINRMDDETEGFMAKGAILFEGQNTYHKHTDLPRLRTKIGMVFQKPCVFPKSICENVLFGIQHLRKLSREEKMHIAEENLKAVSLWNEVSHRLHKKAISLSIGQQQRLCIARTLAVKPKVILLDEPTSSLDPVSTRAIEELMLELKKNYTIIFVTHNINQARRIADHLIFMCEGGIIEQGPKERLFRYPENQKTKAYLNDEYCDC